MDLPDGSGWTLVHAVCRRGTPTGNPEGHAWLEHEQEGLMWEPERNACTDLAAWREAVRPRYRGRWGRSAMMLALLQHNHWGPWEARIAP